MQNIGRHALEHVEKAQGKRGGGLTEYARLIGKSLGAVSQFRAGGEVYSELLKSTKEVDGLQNKTTHLFEIHAARHDEKHDLWPVLAKALLKYDIGVKAEVKRRCKAGRAFERRGNGGISKPGGSSGAPKGTWKILLSGDSGGGAWNYYKNDPAKAPKR